ncbi:hypothetical protein F1599_10285 [Cupriavidus cauae]|uniref:Uncharacterized protein n=1 Tax=Cupriavidus cauae TaxID=2608999 RepID=A0A5M8AR57_9BURK|nr:hypothetical protein F1599_10285 [Cupriavidus cauae]
MRRFFFGALGLGPLAFGLGPWALGLGPWGLGALGPWGLAAQCGHSPRAISAPYFVSIFTAIPSSVTVIAPGSTCLPLTCSSSGLKVCSG